MPSVNYSNSEEYKYNKYAYITRSTWLFRMLYAFGIISWCLVLYGYSQFFNLNIWYWVIFTPAVLIATIYYLLNYGINLFFKKFDLKKHIYIRTRYWNRTFKLPSVDIFIPTCGEDLQVIRKTIEGALNINYKRKKIYILDDKGDISLKKLCEELSVNYLSRPNKGEMKKAGNLKYGFDRTHGDYIAVFDCDFVPHRDFLYELLPYTKDKSIGIIQSPQFFRTDDETHKKSALEFGAGHSQEDFYRIVQVSRNQFGGAICVGSNALYNRKALAKVGGTAQIEHSEDVHTGFNLLKIGYKVRFVPIILALGLCPDNLHSYFKQQHRWCSGSMALVFKSGLLSSNLSIMQKLCYLSGVFYYLNHAAAVLLSIQVFLLLINHGQFIRLENTLPFLPFIAFIFLLSPLFRLTKPKWGSYFAPTVFSYTYAHAIQAHFRKKPLGWSPSNAKSSSLSREFKQLVFAVSGYFLVYIGLISWLIKEGSLPLNDFNYYSIYIWFMYNMLLMLFLIINSYRMMVSGVGVIYQKPIIWMNDVIALLLTFITLKSFAAKRPA